MKRYILYTILTLLTLAGCSKAETEQPKASGYGTLDMSGIIIEDATRAVSAEDFTITVYDAGNSPVGSWTKSEMPETVSLEAGDYTVTAHSPSLDGAAWESPYYFGSQSATVVKDQTTPVTVRCTLANIKVAVAYSEDLQAALSDGESYATRITVADSWLDFENGDSRNGYFRAAETLNTMRISFTGTVDGVKENFSMEIDGVKAGQFRKVILTISSQAGDHDLGAVIESWQQDPDLEAGK